MKSILFTILLTMGIIGSSIVKAEVYGGKLCQDDSKYDCYRVQRGDTWDKLFPDPQKRAIAMRVNRMNIQMQRGMLIAIPKDLNYSNLLDYSPFPKQINPPGEKIIYISLNQLAWGAYNADGSLQTWGAASGARGWCPDIHRACRTSTGNFAIFQKQGANCKSTRYPVPNGGAPMPYCMFFNGNFAMHGSYEVPGYAASHGCVRMFVEDAKWLNESFVGKENVPVIVRQL